MDFKKLNFPVLIGFNVRMSDTFVIFGCDRLNRWRKMVISKFLK